MIPSWPHFAHGPHESLYPRLWTGLVGAWVPALGVQGLTLFDVSGYAQHGTLTNMSLPADWISDGGVPALDFDGTDAYVNCGTSPRFDFGDSNFSLLCWFRTDVPDGPRQILIGKDGDTGRQFILTYDQGNNFTDQLSIYYVKAGPAFCGLVSGNDPITDTAWHFLVGQRIGNSFELYLDGVLLASGTNDGTHGTMQATTTELWLGRRPLTGEIDPLNGAIRLAAIYRRALTADEIRTFYYEPLAPFLPQPRQRRIGSLETGLSVNVSDTLSTTDNHTVRVPIAFDAFSNPTAGIGDLSWTHTPVNIPRGVLVLIAQNVGITDEVLSVTYGGVTMAEVALSPLLHSQGAEDGALYGYFLGADIPTGAQTVTIDVDATGSSKQAVALSFTAFTAATRVEDTDSLDSSSATNPAATLVTGTDVVTAYAGVLHSGQQQPTGVAAGTGASEVLEHDFGSQVASWIRGTAHATGGNVTLNWTAAAEEAAFLAVAIREDSLWINVSDTLTTTDDVTVSLPVSAPSISIDDTLTITESTTIAVPLAANLSDVVTSTEGVTAVVPLQISLADSVTTTDSVTIAPLALMTSLSDTATLTDVLSIAPISMVVVLDDSVTTTENLLAAIFLTLSQSDLIVITEDTQTTPYPLFVSADDTLTITDATTAVIPLQVSIADSVSTTDSVTIAPVVMALSLSDASTLTDALTVAPLLLAVALDDLLTVTEITPFAFPGLTISVSDTLTVTDETIPALGITLSIIETISTTDDITVAPIHIRADFADSLTTTDALTITPIETRVLLSDVLTITESVEQALAPLAISIVDSATVTDEVTTAIGITVATVDTLLSTDALNIAPIDLRIDFADAVTVTDDPAVTVAGAVLTPSVSDTILVTENVVGALLLSLSSIDLSTTTDNAVASIPLVVNISDSVSATDTVTVAPLQISLSLSDALIITEDVTVAVPLKVITIDSLTVTDEPTVAPLYLAVALTEAITTTDEPAVTIASAVSTPQGSDILTVTESITVIIGAAPPLQVSIVDPMTIDDMHVGSIPMAVTATDFLTSIEALINTMPVALSTEDTCAVTIQALSRVSMTAAASDLLTVEDFIVTITPYPLSISAREDMVILDALMIGGIVPDPTHSASGLWREWSATGLWREWDATGWWREWTATGRWKS